MGRKSKNAGIKKKMIRGCDIPHCENTSAGECANCSKCLCNTCMYGCFTAQDHGETISIKCPFCRCANDIYDNEIITILRKCDTLDKLVKVEPYCADCLCEHSYSAILELIPCPDGCYDCSGTKLKKYKTVLT